MNERTAAKLRRWRYKGAGIFVLFHFTVLILFAVVRLDALLILEAPVYIFAMMLPSLADAIIQMCPHPSVLRGALNPGTFIASTLLWASLGYAAGRLAEGIMGSELPKTRA